MPDISMCLDDECPSRRTCRRHKASGTRPNDPWQAYAAFRHDSASGRCEDYDLAPWTRGAAEKEPTDA